MHKAKYYKKYLIYLLQIKYHYVIMYLWKVGFPQNIDVYNLKGEYTNEHKRYKQQVRE